VVTGYAKKELEAGCAIPLVRRTFWRYSGRVAPVTPEEHEQVRVRLLPPAASSRHTSPGTSSGCSSKRSYVRNHAGP
jgi:hypothetical protein